MAPDSSLPPARHRCLKGCNSPLYHCFFLPYDGNGRRYLHQCPKHSQVPQPTCFPKSGGDPVYQNHDQFNVVVMSRQFCTLGILRQIQFIEHWDNNGFKTTYGFTLDPAPDLLLLPVPLPLVESVDHQFEESPPEEPLLHGERKFLVKQNL